MINITSSVIKERVTELRLLGKNLAQLLTDRDINMSHESLSEQFMYVYQLARVDRLHAVAVSVLICKVPIQIEISQSDIIKLMDWSLLKIISHANMSSVIKLKEKEKTQKEKEKQKEKNKNKNMEKLHELRVIENENTKKNKNQKSKIYKNTITQGVVKGTYIDHSFTHRIERYLKDNMSQHDFERAKKIMLRRIKKNKKDVLKSTESQLDGEEKITKTVKTLIEISKIGAEVDELSDDGDELFKRGMSVPDESEWYEIPDNSPMVTREQILEEGVYRPYRIKRPNMEGLKSNVWFTDVWKSLQAQQPGLAIEFLNWSAYTSGWTNDKASACLMAAVALNEVIEHAMEYSIRMINDPVGCKNLTVLLKGLGMNSDSLGSMITESISLQGMPEQKLDLHSEVKMRCKPGNTIKFNDLDLIRCINKIFDEEIDLEKYRPESSDDTWSKRWLWSTNGGHSRNVEKHEKKWRIDIKERMYRKSAMENYKRNAIDLFNGKVYVGGSVKPEIGKPGRVIMSCDTISYAAFSHLLMPVEQCWRNKSVLLDPGSLGPSGICRRVNNINNGRIHLMLDYDAFDTQHSLRAQTLVIDQLCKYLKYDDTRSKLLSDSFNRMLLHVDGKPIGYAQFSLMSGHRGTTFINSVLNKAYLMMAMGGSWEGFNSLHTGDDVYAAVNDYKLIDTFLDNISKYNIRMNPMKQSIGNVGAEFLRMGIRKKYSTGYMMRSIGRCISGNWEVEDVHDESESLSNWMNMGRTILNRSRSKQLIKLLSLSMSRSTRIMEEVCYNLMIGYQGIDGSNLQRPTASWYGYKIKRDQKKDKINLPDEYGTNATDDYLSNHVTEVEKTVMTSLGISVKTDMLLASYAKNKRIHDQISKVESITLSSLYGMTTHGCRFFEELQNEQEEKNGVLLKYPLLNLMKTKMDRETTIHAIRMCGETPRTNWKLQAWGSEFGYNVIHGVLSFSDASVVSRYVGNKIVNVKYFCYL